jgi:hypothetical protein
MGAMLMIAFASLILSNISFNTKSTSILSFGGDKVGYLLRNADPLEGKPAIT